MKQIDIPCSIHDGKMNCGEPFCEHIFYQLMAEKAYQKWKRKIRRELKAYKNENP